MGEQLYLGRPALADVAVAHRVAERDPSTGPRVERRSGGPEAGLHVVGDVPLEDLAVAAGDNPAVHVVGDAAAFGREEVAVHVGRVDPCGTQARNEVRVDVDTGPGGGAAGEVRHRVAALVERVLGVGVREAGLGLGHQRLDGPAPTTRFAGHLPAGRRQLLGCAAVAVAPRDERRFGIARAGTGDLPFVDDPEQAAIGLDDRGGQAQVGVDQHIDDPATVDPGARDRLVGRRRPRRDQHHGAGFEAVDVHGYLACTWFALIGLHEREP